MPKRFWKRFSGADGAVHTLTQISRLKAVPFFLGNSACQENLSIMVYGWQFNLILLEQYSREANYSPVMSLNIYYIRIWASL